MTGDIADAVAFLASDRASFVHGHDMIVDGGVILGGRRWQEGVEFRANLYNKIKERLDD